MGEQVASKGAGEQAARDAAYISILARYVQCMCIQIQAYRHTGIMPWCVCMCPEERFEESVEDRV